MNSKDQKLDQLLKNLEVDRPSSDFTNDIMQMISSESLSRDALISKNISRVDQAPKHMTDLVMESITPTESKSFELLNKREKRNLILVLLAVIIISGLADSVNPSSLVFNFDAITNTVESFFNSSVSTTFLILTAGTGLWIMDQFVRARVRRV